MLFDEIEKAHPRILDKFLQILEDGRLTDGRGNTAYFSECVLIFTSNLGIIVEDPATGQRVQNVAPRHDVRRRWRRRSGRRSGTTSPTELSRPELLNRLGDNIVVFDFITAEVAGGIFDLQLGNVIRQVQEDLGVTLVLDEAAGTALRERCARDETLDNGGRGIGSVIESSFVNPLARFLFDVDCEPGTTVTVRSISWSVDDSPTLDCVRS